MSHYNIIHVILIIGIWLKVRGNNLSLMFFSINSQTFSLTKAYPFQNKTSLLCRVRKSNRKDDAARGYAIPLFIL